MELTRGKGTRVSRVTTEEANDWLAQQLRRQSSKHIAAKTGISPRTAEALRLGRHGLKFAHIVELARNDAEFRSAFIQFCGGKLEGDPEMLKGLTLAVQSYMQEHHESMAREARPGS